MIERSDSAAARAIKAAHELERAEPCRDAEGGQQTFVDTYAKVGFAKLYDAKTAITAADLFE